MKTYVIETDNNIIAFDTVQEAETTEGDRFTSLEQLTELAVEWQGARLVEIWNSIPGLTPVKRFTNRQAAVGRIWKAIQSLDGGKAARTGTGEAPKARKAKARTRSAENGRRNRPKKPKPGAREGSKKATVLELIRRKAGATLNQLMEATGWQAHSVRGFLSGMVGKKMGLEVESNKRADGERVYRLNG